MECIEYNLPLKSMMCMHDIHISQSEESAHSESFRGSRKSQFRIERNLNTQKKLVLRNSQNNWTKWFVRTSKVGLPRVCFFCSTERNSEHFCLPRNGSELNSEGLLLFLFHCTEFQAFFSSKEWFGTEFREFSVLRNSLNSAGTNQLFRPLRLPRNNFFVGNCQP